ncbi:MAG: hypothetical protein A2428_01075 [Bdellovibrionales bacterium RIFOXYC1_FULL_54_43]|nr:MAG: hypothetical protein A2428_01075 [Bdellovibrionales bacterium RIFOXYC1_FULL_54_43]OFZ82876.1 MAG: hypothetical protein A2603_11795 [Bdellovibrionales bacterium RIFOXYD1_FULL_55_31]
MIMLIEAGDPKPAFFAKLLSPKAEFFSFFCARTALKKLWWVSYFKISGSTGERMGWIDKRITVTAQPESILFVHSCEHLDG